MNKSELVYELSRVTNLTLKDCNKCLSALTKVVIDTLNSGGNINLTGFGKFEVRHKKARNSFNPVLKKIVKLPAKNLAYFKPGKALREATFN